MAPVSIFGCRLRLDTIHAHFPSGFCCHAARSKRQKGSRFTRKKFFKFIFRWHIFSKCFIKHFFFRLQSVPRYTQFHARPNHWPAGWLVMESRKSEKPAAATDTSLVSIWDWETFLFKNNLACLFLVSQWTWATERGQRCQLHLRRRQ